MSLILYIYKPRQNTKIYYIYREIAINLGKTKKRKGLFHIYKKPPIEKQLYIRNLGKVQKNIYRKYWGKIYKKWILPIYRNTLWGEPKKKKCLFPIYIRRKKHLQENTQILGKIKKKKGCYSIYRKHITERVIFPIYR